ncbi:MAG: hypothetical protein JWM44_3120 [Bacilli bacterium]|nr:hypothetical protein [Bacilli bacterium]
MKVTWANNPSQTALNAAYKDIIPKALEAYLKTQPQPKDKPESA